ncbi:MAG: HAD-IA family hydrolase [Sphaerospermopsis sp. SIO1G2]|nr:HAD-IA family hydrolase [Sphaerospermopsis sp. SIO1G1]NET71569.1 HAD-IA family hydrolase [Sphaerospermopsis sp. SIO1G2]
MLTAILFDLDGTIVNTDPIHYQAWREMLLNYSVEIDETFYKSRISGRLNPDIIKDILPHLSLAEADKFADDKEAMFRDRASHLKPMDGFLELIKWTEKQDIKRALVTNAPRLNAEFMLDILGIKQFFHTIVLADDCIAGKPDPEPYKVALSKLGITAQKAVALEDSPSGIFAAVAAQIPTIGVTSTHDPQILENLGAFMTISDFTNLRLWTWLDSSIAPEMATVVM